MWGALHAYSFDRQTRNQRTFVLCGKHFAFHIWLGFLFKRKTRKQRENTVSVRRAHTHTHTYLFVAFPARGTLEMSTEREGEEGRVEASAMAAKWQWSRCWWRRTGQRTEKRNGICCWRRKVCHTSCLATHPYAYFPLYSLYFYQPSCSLVFSLEFAY